VSEPRWDERGLVPVVAQDRATGEVRMVAFANSEALKATLETGVAHFYSRSRAALWRKGETSGNELRVAEVWLDCDADTLLYLIDPSGPTCHTGAEACFVDPVQARPGASLAAPILLALTREIDDRAASTASKSYTRALLDGGPAAIAKKVEEEAAELARALEAESDERVRAEAADLLYHAMVGLRARGLSLADVVRTLAERMGTSGHAEKASRSK
jgi:phosphoribosyl-ATP pyrophosphohydrolase/phosphoribosyl-AMP cyclohydrolase